jgi:hypothetical protein
LWVGLWVENLTPRGPPCPHLPLSHQAETRSLRPERASNFPRSDIYSLIDRVADFPEEDFWPASKSAIKCRVCSAVTQAEHQSQSPPPSIGKH